MGDQVAPVTAVRKSPFLNQVSSLWARKDSPQILQVLLNIGVILFVSILCRLQVASLLGVWFFVRD